MKKQNDMVSVPIRGLFNLTFGKVCVLFVIRLRVSVPIRGLFNLTKLKANAKNDSEKECFRPHQGII